MEKVQSTVMCRFGWKRYRVPLCVGLDGKGTEYRYV